MKKTPLLTAMMALTLLSTPAFASAFRAADTIYLPVAGKTRGANNAFFQTDVWISNLSADRIVVDVAFAPTEDEAGPKDNRNVTLAANLKRVPTPINPNQRLEILDIMEIVFGIPDSQDASGMLIFFPIRENGTAVDCGTPPNDCRIISVEARIYNTALPGSNLPEGATFGQLVPGLPWYDFISQDAAFAELRNAFLVGIRMNAEYRTNIGLVNASAFSTTTIRARLFNADGTQFGSDFTLALPPLAHAQRRVDIMFPGYSGSGAWLTVEQANTVPTDPNDPDCGGGCPGFFAYGSLIDQESNDPMYLETQYRRTLQGNEQIQCIYGKVAIPRIVRR
jgi:hypothetical protein